MSRVRFGPLLTLGAAAVAVHLLLVVTGRFEPRWQRDTESYRDFDWSSLALALEQPRTVGYPLFLKLAERVAPDLAAVPLLQWFAHLLAVLIFYLGLRAAGIRGGPAVASCLPLLIGRSVIHFVPQVTGDALAVSCSIAAMGCLLGINAARGRWAAWGGLTLFTLLAYQIRPAYLFLVALWPVLGLLLDVLVVRRGRSAAEYLHRVGLLAALSVLPLVAFCALRAATVGHFGLVSFGGYNIVGIAGQLLDDDLVPNLSADLQPLARDILRRRRPLPDEPARDFHAMEARYNDIIWQVALPAATEHFGDDRVALNRGLARLSREILESRRAEYLQWLVGNAKHALMQIHLLMLLDIGSVLAALVILGALGYSLFRGPASQSAERRGDEVSIGPMDFREVHLLLWSALAFAAAKTMLVILVEPAIDRYMTGAMIFLPAVVGGLAWRVIVWVRGSRP